MTTRIAGLCKEQVLKFVTMGYRKFRPLNYRLFMVFLGLLIFFSFQLIIVRRIVVKKSSQNLSLLIISVDTLRADHMGIYGYPKNTTPNIDKWAKDAFVFTDMKTIIPLTYPSFASLMTGLNPLETGILKNLDIINDKLVQLKGAPPLRNTDLTLAQILRKSGFDETAAFVSNGVLDPDFTHLNKGFEQYDVLHGSIDPNTGEKYKSLSAVETALNWLEKNKDKRLFLWVHVMEPHAPYYPPKDLECVFNKDFCDEISARGLEDLEHERKKFHECRPQGVPKEKVELFETLYDGAVASADRLAGKIIDKLRATGLDKNTIVVFYGDHGEGFDHNYYFGHGLVLYDSQVKIPFIVKHPLLSASGREIDASLQNTQILPTLLDLLSIPSKGYKFSGSSFATFFYGDLFSKLLYKSERPTYLIAPSRSKKKNFSKFAIQIGRYKYISSLNDGGACLLGGQTEELYDLENDPQEVENLTREKPNMVNELKTKLFTHFSQYDLPKMSAEVEYEKIPSQKQEMINELKSLGY